MNAVYIDHSTIHFVYAWNCDFDLAEREFDLLTSQSKELLPPSLPSELSDSLIYYIFINKELIQF